MKKLLFLLVTLVVVSALLAGAFAYFQQQRLLRGLDDRAGRAAELIEAGQFADAVPALKKIQEEGGLPRATFLMGKALQGLGRPADAMNEYAALVRRWPRSEYVPEAAYQQALNTLRIENRPEEAKQQFVQVIEAYPDSGAADQALLQLAKQAQQEGNAALARKSYEALARKAASPAKDEAEFALGDMNMAQLRSPEPGPGDEVYTIQKGDLIGAIARKFKVTPEFMIQFNRINPNRMRVGQTLKIPQLDISITVDKARRQLIVRNRNTLLKKYRVGIVRAEKKLPEGEYSIGSRSDKGQDFIDMEQNVVIKAGDASNPYGTRYLGIKRDMALHGTNNSALVGTYTNRGSVTMRNEDIEELFPIVQTRVPVVVKGKVQEEGGAGAGGASEDAAADGAAAGSRLGTPAR